MEIGNTCWFVSFFVVDEGWDGFFFAKNLIQLDLAVSHFVNCVCIASIVLPLAYSLPRIQIQDVFNENNDRVKWQNVKTFHMSCTLLNANQTCVFPFLLFSFSHSTSLDDMHCMHRRCCHSTYVCCKLQCMRKIYAHFIDRMEIINMSHNSCVCACTFACATQLTNREHFAEWKTLVVIHIGNGKMVYHKHWAWLNRVCKFPTQKKYDLFRTR